MDVVVVKEEEEEEEEDSSWRIVHLSWIGIENFILHDHILHCIQQIAQRRPGVCRLRDQTKPSVKDERERRGGGGQHFSVP